MDNDNYWRLVFAFRINDPGQERLSAPFDLQINILTVARRSLKGSFGLLFTRRDLRSTRR
jgi:hypothetical protein